MSKSLEKVFVNAGVQSPSEFEVASDNLATQLVSRRTVPPVSPKSRVDSIVQTQDSASELKPHRNKCLKTVITVENYGHGKQSSTNVNSKAKKTKKKYKGMENNPPESGATRTMSDLERKKLEAELKATEQIAKIKQSVIEKRLELELASLQDGYNPNVRSSQQPLNKELKIFENSMERNDMTDADRRGAPYRNPIVPPPMPPNLSPPPSQTGRPPFQLPFPPPGSPTNQYPRDYPKTRNMKNETDFLIKNEIKSLKLSPLSTGNSEQRYPRPGNVGKNPRNITLPERGRFMQTIEKPKYSPSQQMEQNPFKAPIEEPKFVQAPQISVTEAYYANRLPEPNANPQQDVQAPGCSPVMAPRGGKDSHSVWKSLMSKMKKKLKKPPQPWQ